MIETCGALPFVVLTARVASRRGRTPESRAQSPDEADRRVAVDALDDEPGGGEPLVHARHRVLEVCHVELAVLADEAPHEPRADPGRPGAALAAGGAPPVVDEHLGHAAARPAALRRAQPEVPVLAALDEARVVAAHVFPELPPVERGDVDGAAG